MSGRICEPDANYIPRVYAAPVIEVGERIRVYDSIWRLHLNSGEITGDEYHWNMDNAFNGIYMYLIEGDVEISVEFIVMRRILNS